MNREILFRGKRVDGKGWVYGDLIHGVNHKNGMVFILPVKGGVSSLSSGIDPIDGWNVIPETVGQFTGLKDKNGTKIFEGDILKSKTGHLFQVRFINSQWMAMGINPPSSRGLTYEVFYATETIGNIHDNSTP